jgi:hypothetical protein
MPHLQLSANKMHLILQGNVQKRGVSASGIKNKA